MTFPQVPLSQILLLANRPETPASGKLYRQIGVSLWGEGAYEREPIDGAATQYQRLFQAKAKDVIVNKIWARNGSVAVVPEQLDGCYGSNEFPMFIPRREKLEPRWFHWLTKTRGFWDKCDEKSRGTSGKNRIRPERFLEIEIPLPSLSEQRRIVARIEKLASKIKETHSLRELASLDTDALEIGAFRQMRETLLGQDLPRKKIGQVAKVTSGGTPSRQNPTYWEGNIPWVTSGELLDGDICDTEQHVTKEGFDNSSAKLFPLGTVLIGLYGQGQTRGRTGLLTIEAATNQACCAILPTPSILEPRFTQYWLRGLYDELRTQSRDGAQPNWNGKMIKNIEIAIPAVSEQRRIVGHLDRLQEKIGALKRIQKQTALEVDVLIPSILDKAFRGEL